MNKIIQYRGNASICRQQAVFDFEHSWYWLDEAEMWSHKAHDEIAAHFRECTIANPVNIAKTEKPKIAA